MEEPSPSNLQFFLNAPPPAIKTNAPHGAPPLHLKIKSKPSESPPLKSEASFEKMIPRKKP